MNPYQVLGVSQTDDEDIIKKAYRKAAKECHPDTHPGDKRAEERFKEIGEAYRILSDKQKRKEYDARAAQRERESATGRYSAQTGRRSAGGSIYPGDIEKEFERFFSKGVQSEKKENSSQQKINPIVQKFMEELYHSGRIQDFSFIKLTGQSCKIDLFKDALKEFVPGRMIQFRKRANIDAADFELKMTCVDGALKYLRDRKYGLADIHLNNGKAVLPYRITAYTHNGKEVVLVDGFKDWDTAGTISRNMEDLILPLYLKNADGEEHCRFQYVCRQEDFSQKSYEEIEAVYGSHILQKETDSIENGDVKFFVWAEQEEWGFQVVPVYCEMDELYLGKAEFFSFESDNWVNSFFDGKK